MLFLILVLVLLLVRRSSLPSCSTQTCSTFTVRDGFGTGNEPYLVSTFLSRVPGDDDSRREGVYACSSTQVSLSLSLGVSLYLSLHQCDVPRKQKYGAAPPKDSAYRNGRLKTVHGTLTGAL